MPFWEHLTLPAQGWSHPSPQPSLEKMLPDV